MYIYKKVKYKEKQNEKRPTKNLDSISWRIKFERTLVITQITNIRVCILLYLMHARRCMYVPGESGIHKSLIYQTDVIWPTDVAHRIKDRTWICRENLSVVRFVIQRFEQCLHPRDCCYTMAECSTMAFGN